MLVSKRLTQCLFIKIPTLLHVSAILDHPQAVYNCAHVRSCTFSLHMVVHSVGMA